MVKPDAYTNIGKIISIIEQNFNINNIKMCKFSGYDAVGNKKNQIFLFLYVFFIKMSNFSFFL